MHFKSDHYASHDLACPYIFLTFFNDMAPIHTA